MNEAISSADQYSTSPVRRVCASTIRALNVIGLFGTGSGRSTAPTLTLAVAVACRPRDSQVPGVDWHVYKDPLGDKGQTAQQVTHGAP